MKPSASQLFALRRVQSTTVGPTEVNSGGRGVAASTYRSLIRHGLVEWDYRMLQPSPTGVEMLKTYTLVRAWNAKRGWHKRVEVKREA